MEDLYQNLQVIRGADELLLDVRGQGEFVQGHIEGAVNIPHDAIQASHATELASYKKVHVFCFKGGRASMAVESLLALGVNHCVCIDENGMEYWYSKGYPVVKGS